MVLFSILQNQHWQSWNSLCWLASRLVSHLFSCLVSRLVSLFSRVVSLFSCLVSRLVSRPVSLVSLFNRGVSLFSCLVSHLFSRLVMQLSGQQLMIDI